MGSAYGRGNPRPNRAGGVGGVAGYEAPGVPSPVGASTVRHRPAPG